MRIDITAGGEAEGGKSGLSRTMRIDLSADEDTRVLPPESPPTRRFKRLTARPAHEEVIEGGLGDGDFQELLQSVYDGAVVTDLQGNGIDANVRACQFLGYERHEFAGLNILQILSGADESLLPTIWETLANDRFVLVHANCTRKNGSQFPTEISVNPLRLSVQDYLCFFLRDIRLRVEAERALEKARDELEERVEERTGELMEANLALRTEIAEREKAEHQLAELVDELKRSNTELEQFAYVASHDLQEPLRMVAGYTQLLADRYKEKLDADADEFISFAAEGANRMQQLIGDLLSYSRVSARTDSFEAVDCTAVLERVLASLRFAIEYEGATVAHDPLPTVSGDETQLGRVFMNLVENAVKFHGDDPPQVQVSCAEREGEWVFSVRDNGIGFDPQFRERVFVIFQRLHPQDKYPGTGIGLAVCRKIVERHGGTMWAETEPGRGSTFSFTLPRSAPAADATGAGEPQ